MNIEETISISEEFRILVEKDAIIYRNEFEEFRKQYQKSGKEEKLIFAFLFLQIYMECFLHQRMRKIMEMEFDFKRPDLFQVWDKRESSMHINEKIGFFISFFIAGDKAVNFREKISKLFSSIGKPRNKFAHGHALTKMISKEGVKHSSALSILNLETLNSTISYANQLGETWNELLDEISKECKVLKGLGSFKFIEIES